MHSAVEYVKYVKYVTDGEFAGPHSAVSRPGQTAQFEDADAVSFVAEASPCGIALLISRTVPEGHLAPRRSERWWPTDSTDS